MHGDQLAKGPDKYPDQNIATNYGGNIKADKKQKPLISLHEELMRIESKIEKATASLNTSSHKFMSPEPEPANAREKLPPPRDFFHAMSSVIQRLDEHANNLVEIANRFDELI